MHRVRARDHEGAVEEEQGDGVVQTRDGGCSARGPALAERESGVVDESFVCRISAEAETLRAAVAAVEEDDGAVGEEGAFDHAAAFGHRVHFPMWGGGERLDAAAGGIGGGSDVLVRAASADDYVGGPVVGGDEGEEDGSASVGVCAVVAGEIRVGSDDGVGRDGEGLGGFGDEDEEIAIRH